MIKYPIEYELSPRELEMGTRWLSATLKNVGTESLTGLDVKLNSMDAYGLGVFGTGSYVPILDAQEETTLPFQVSANFTTTVYISIDASKNGAPYHWESPALGIEVGKERAKITGLFAMTEPYPLLGEKIRCEATLRGQAESQGLDLEFWADTPDGDFEELGIIETKPLEAGEEVRYSAEFMPEMEGMYTLYAYLYDGVRRIGREVEYVYVREA